MTKFGTLIREARSGYANADRDLQDLLDSLADAIQEEQRRADRAEARIAQVKALRDKWMRDGEQPDLWIAINKALSEATA